MYNRIEFALAWKEFRQSYPIILAFTIFTFLTVAYTRYQYNHTDPGLHLTLQESQNMIGHFFFFVSLGLAYLLASGNRLLEEGQNLDNYLFARPVERGTILKVYYVTSLFGFLLWMLLSFLFVFLFFGFEIFITPNHKHLMWEFFLHYFILFLLVAHAFTFCVSLVYPSLVVTSTVFLISYLITFKTVSDPYWIVEFFKKSLFLLPGLVSALPVLLIFGLLILWTIRAYQQKQVR